MTKQRHPYRSETERNTDIQTDRKIERQFVKTLYWNTMKKQLHRKTDRQKQNVKMIVLRHPYRLKTERQKDKKTDIHTDRKIIKKDT